MKYLNLAAVSASNGMYFSSGSINLMQDAIKEGDSSLGQHVIGPSYSSGTVYVLYGCETSTSGGSTVITAGAIFYNGEIYQTAATTVGTTGTIYANIVPDSITATNYDPTEFTDGTPRNVHINATIKFTQASSGSDLCTLADLVRILGNPKFDNVTFSASTGTTVNFKRNRIFIDATTGASTTFTFAYDFSGAIPGATVTYEINANASGTTLAFPASGSGTNTYINNGSGSLNMGNQPFVVELKFLGNKFANNVAVNIYKYN